MIQDNKIVITSTDIQVYRETHDCSSVEAKRKLQNKDLAELLEILSYKYNAPDPLVLILKILLERIE